MKSTFFLLILTTFVAVAYTSSERADGNVTCTKDSCIFIVNPINDQKFTGNSKSFQTNGITHLSGILTTDDLTNLHAHTDHLIFCVELKINNPKS